MTTVPQFDLQQIFSDKIVASTLFPDVHVGQASYVWLVETTTKRQIVRTTRLSGTPPNEFWWGCKELFGVVPENVHCMAQINQTLRTVSTLPVPEVLSTPTIDAIPFVVVEELPGKTVHSFSHLAVPSLEQLGRDIASIHLAQKPCFGNFSGTMVQPISKFPLHAARVCEQLVLHFYQDKPEFESELPHMMSLFVSMDAPSAAVPVLLDIDPTQFLTDGAKITSLVDTEVYAWGPAEWDLVALEYLLDEPRASAFRQGYQSISKMPILKSVREPFRFLQRVMELQGAVPLEKWMNQPIWFD